MSLRPHFLKRAIQFFAMLGALSVIVCLLLAAFVYKQQDKVVNKILEELNHDFSGRLEIANSHISPFANFPYVSIDLEEVRVYETKSETSEVLLHVADAYVGFNIWDLINSDIEIKRLRFDQGFISLVQHTDGSFNITNALSGSGEDNAADSSAFHIDLQSIELTNIDVLKFNEANGILAEAFIEHTEASFRKASDSIQISLDSKFLFNLIIDGDISFLHDKHLNVKTNLGYDVINNVLKIEPTEVHIENATFQMEGAVNVEEDMNLDLVFKGNKPNFDLFLAFAPPELKPLLERYDNGGRIYFEAIIKGQSINGYSPKIDVDFGCEEAFVRNTQAGKGVDELFFNGHFTNGEKRDPSTMSLVIRDFSARPETGKFTGNVEVVNFDSPEIDMQLTSEFDLDFLAQFLNLDHLKDVSGQVSLEMNFHDIIDLSRPEKSIEKLNESYFTKLIVNDLNFTSSTYGLPVSDVNIKAEMDGHKARIDQLDFKIGQSDVSIHATVSDLPAILHHTDLPVEAILDIKSDLIDLGELTFAENDSAGIDEQITNLSMEFRFNSSARAFTESPNLPVGEFFINRLHARFNHYPHELHDFNADIIIDEADFNVLDFKGMIDESDFHFSGKLANYDLWFEEKPSGSTVLEYNLSSQLLQLEDIFTYRGENYVPEDYRHEEFRNLKIHGLTTLNFEERLDNVHTIIDRLEANMKIHPMRFEKFSGEFIISDRSLEARNVQGILGNSDFKASLKYYFDGDSSRRDHDFSLKSNRLDFDQLFAYNPPPPDEKMSPEAHEDGFNIFELPFTNMNFNLGIKHLNYHRILIDGFAMKGRMQKDHFVYLDSMEFKAADGRVSLNGYFNGSDPNAIYFSPNLKVENIDLDKVMFKFENFGQDHLVSENLHGKLTGSLNGKVHMHADMVPIIDDSELHMNFNVTQGSLHNYSVFHALSDYFTDKNLDLVRFDTLQNTLDLKDGKLSIPSMNINSTLGYFEVSGIQDADLSMEYYLRIPVKVVTRAAAQKLFGNKDMDTSGQIDEIQYRNTDKRTRFINLKIEGTPEDYQISLGRQKREATDLALSENAGN